MKRAKLFSVIMLLVTLAGCGEGNEQLTDDFITVDVSASYPKKELILQDFLDVEYIPLETNDDYITSGYVQAIGTDIILARNINQAGAGNIFVFDRNGKGLRKINRRGQGHEEYTNITGLIAIDEDNDEMFVNCYGLRKIFVYDLFGNFKRSLRYMEGGDESGSFKKDIGYDPIYNFDNENLICQDNTSGRNFIGTSDVDVELRNIFYIISKRDGSVTKEIQIPFEKKIPQVVFAGAGTGMVNNPGLIRYHDRWILVEPSSDTIYSYSSDHRMKPFIVRTPSVQSMNPEIFLFLGVITDRYCFMQTVKKEYHEMETGSRLLETELVYDKEDNKIFEYVLYNDDFINKRPIRNLVNDILKLTVVNNEEVVFAETIEASELVGAYEEGKLKGKLKEIAASLDEESNPVIMLAKYKK